MTRQELIDGFLLDFKPKKDQAMEKLLFFFTLLKKRTQHRCGAN